MAAGSRSGGGGKRVVIRVVRVSGTIRKVEEEAVRLARREIVLARADGQLRGEGEGRLDVGSGLGLRVKRGVVSEDEDGDEDGEEEELDEGDG